MSDLTLIGTSRSPYVRKLRLFLAESNYHYKEVDFDNLEDLRYLESHNALRKIPILLDGNQTIIESRQIYEHIQAMIFKKSRENTEFQNVLSIIDGVLDAGFIAFQAKKFIDDYSTNLLYQKQCERIERSLKYLDSQKLITKWNYLGQSLLSTVEWFHFRDVYECSSFQYLLNFVEENQNRPAVKETAPF